MPLIHANSTIRNCECEDGKLPLLEMGFQPEAIEEQIPEFLLKLRGLTVSQLDRVVLCRTRRPLRIDVKRVYCQPWRTAGKHGASVSERAAELEPVGFDDQRKKAHASSPKREMVDLETRHRRGAWSLLRVGCN